MDRFSAIDTAKRIVAERYPDASAAFLGRLTLSESNTPSGDLDIVIILRNGPAPFRETIQDHGWHIELFVHTPATVKYFSMLEAIGHRATTEKMIADGSVLLSLNGAAEQIQSVATAHLAKGPSQIPDEELKRRRYVLTELLDDLSGTSNRLEIIYLVGQLIVGTSELALLTKFHWLASGKRLPRHLAICEPELSKRIVEATDAAIIGGKKEDLEAIVREVLAGVGGPLKEGYPG
jgi:hypothetical protein